MGRSGANMGQTRLDVGVTDLGQALASRAAGGDRRQALLGVTAVPLQVLGDEGLQQGALLSVQVAAGDQVLGQGPRLVAGPGVEGGDQGRLVDQAVLKRE